MCHRCRGPDLSWSHYVQSVHTGLPAEPKPTKGAVLLVEVWTVFAWTTFSKSNMESWLHCQNRRLAVKTLGAGAAGNRWVLGVWRARRSQAEPSGARRSQAGSSSPLLLMRSDTIARQWTFCFAVNVSQRRLANRPPHSSSNHWKLPSPDSQWDADEEKWNELKFFQLFYSLFAFIDGQNQKYQISFVLFLQQQHTGLK